MSERKPNDLFAYGQAVSAFATPIKKRVELLERAGNAVSTLGIAATNQRNVDRLTNILEGVRGIFFDRERLLSQEEETHLEEVVLRTEMAAQRYLKIVKKRKSPK